MAICVFLSSFKLYACTVLLRKYGEFEIKANLREFWLVYVKIVPNVGQDSKKKKKEKKQRKERKKTKKKGTVLLCEEQF